MMQVSPKGQAELHENLICCRIWIHRVVWQHWCHCVSRMSNCHGSDHMRTLSRQGFSTDFRGAKSTHIPRGKAQRFSRNMDAFCEVIFRPIGPRATPLLRGDHLFIGSQGLAELPSRRVPWLSAMARGKGKNTSQWSFRVPVIPSRTFAPL